MTSEVDICNQSLGWLGESLIMSLDDGTKGAQLCKANYAELRDTVLEEGKWTFATKRQTFSTPAGEDPDWGYSNRFLLPSTVLVVDQVNDTGNPDDYNLDWRREENYIVTDAATVYATLIFKITDVSKFTSTFKQALASRIAAELAIPLTESKRKEEIMLAKYEDRLRTALSIDGMQGKSRRLRSKNLTSRVR